MALDDNALELNMLETLRRQNWAVLETLLERDMAWFHLPIVANIWGEMTEKVAQVIPLKAFKSMERLLDDTGLPLDRVLSTMPLDKKTLIEDLHQWAPVLADKKILVVDDDVRNLFAMTSILENYQMNVLSVESGAGALALLTANPDIDVVLMDIMMPGMDGYDTIQAIRDLARFKHLPIIAVTARAMRGDQEKCMDAGATGYCSKPVDVHYLLSMMYQWLGC